MDGRRGEGLEWQGATADFYETLGPGQAKLLAACGKVRDGG